MSRLPKLEVDDLDAEQLALYRDITGGPRAQGPQVFSLVDDRGRLEGPFNAMLLNPRMGTALQGLGASVRYQGELSDRAREIAILVVASHWHSAFETYAHERVGGRAGLDEATLLNLRRGATEELADQHDRLVACTAKALCASGDLDDEQFAAAAEGLGLPTLFELLTLVGYYATLALMLRTFRVEAPD